MKAVQQTETDHFNQLLADIGLVLIALSIPVSLYLAARFMGWL